MAYLQVPQMLDLEGRMLGLERPTLGLELQMWAPVSSPIRLVLSGYANHRRWWCLFKNALRVMMMMSFKHLVPCSIG